MKIAKNEERSYWIPSFEPTTELKGLRMKTYQEMNRISPLYTKAKKLHSYYHAAVLVLAISFVLSSLLNINAPMLLAFIK